MKIFSTLLIIALFSISPLSAQTITIDGGKFTEFNIAQKEYTYLLPYTYKGTPEIKAYGAKAKISIKGKNAQITIGTKEVYNIDFVVVPKLDLFLCIGQSNMAGRGKLTEGDFEPLDNVYLLNYSNHFERAKNPMNRYSAVRKDISLQGMSPSYGFSKKVSAQTGRHIGVVVNARGGSSISSWNKLSTKDSLYTTSVKRALEATKWGEFKAIIWHQGESDSDSTRVVGYKEKLINLVANLRKDLGNDKLFFVAGEIAYWREDGKGSLQFNQMIGGISSFIDNSAFVSAKDLTPLIHERDPHFDRNSGIILGERYADIILKNIY